MKKFVRCWLTVTAAYRNTKCTCPFSHIVMCIVTPISKKSDRSLIFAIFFNNINWVYCKILNSYMGIIAPFAIQITICNLRKKIQLVSPCSSNYLTTKVLRTERKAHMTCKTVFHFQNPPACPLKGGQSEHLCRQSSCVDLLWLQFV